MIGPATQARYTRTAALLHWLIAAAIFANLATGLAAAAFERPGEPGIMVLHKGLGITVLLLSLVRLGWRLTHRPPPFAFRHRAERLAAGGVHALLYALMVVVPLSGWLITSAFPGRHPIRLGPLEVPYLPVHPALPLADRAHAAHVVLALTLGSLALGHVAAALRHQFLLRDGLVARMIPGRG